MIERKFLPVKVIALLAALLLTVGFIPASASYTASNVTVYVDDKLISFDSNPYINNDGRTMVPIRFVSERLGGTVGWDPQKMVVTIEKNSDTIKMIIGDRGVTKNGKLQFMDTTPVIKQSRTMVPIRFISEYLGAKVEWVDAKKEVRIYSSGAVQPPAPTDFDSIRNIKDIDQKISALVANDKYAAKLNNIDANKFKQFISDFDTVRANPGSNYSAGMNKVAIFSGDTGKFPDITSHTISIIQNGYYTDSFEDTWFSLEYLLGTTDANKVWTTMMTEREKARKTGEYTNPETGQVYGQITGYNYIVEFGSITMHYYFDKK